MKIFFQLTSEISKIHIISQGTSEDCQEALAAQSISDHHDVNLQENKQNVI